MDYPKWNTLKFMANINLTMLKPEQICDRSTTQLRNACDVTDLTMRTKDTIDHSSCDLILKHFLNIWTFVTEYWIRVSFPFVTYMIRHESLTIWKAR